MYTDASGYGIGGVFGWMWFSAALSPEDSAHSIAWLEDLGATSDLLMNAALRQNTKRTYTSAQSRFIRFCEHYNQVVMPVSEDTLLLYVGFLFEEGLAGSSIRVYLSAVRSLQNWP
jgi:hypothetical protein